MCPRASMFSPAVVSGTLIKRETIKTTNMKLRSLLTIALVPALLTSCLKSKDALGVISDNGSIATGIFDRFYFGAAKTFALNSTPAVETLDLLDIRYSAP